LQAARPDVERCSADGRFRTDGATRGLWVRKIRESPIPFHNMHRAKTASPDRLYNFPAHLPSLANFRAGTIFCLLKRPIEHGAAE
jgi:hypothetical protein